MQMLMNLKNSLPWGVLDASVVQIFKEEVDKPLKDCGIEDSPEGNWHQREDGWVSHDYMEWQGRHKGQNVLHLSSFSSCN